jgi:hypothetical protein
MRLRKFLRKIHRWIGVLASVWLLLLATTGFLLQHKDDWNLDQQYTESKLLLSLYKIGNQYISFETNNSSIAQLDYQIYINKQPVQKLEQQIIAAIYQQPNWIVATDTKVIWINEDGQILQSLDELDGLPTKIENLGNDQYDLFIQSENKSINLETLKPSSLVINWSQASQSEDLKQQLMHQASHNYLSYQQLLFDLHAGITSPSLLNDFAALALIFLSLSGIIIFVKKSFKSQKPSTKIK